MLRNKPDIMNVELKEEFSLIGTSLFPHFNRYARVCIHSYVLSHWFQKQLWSIVASYWREECVETGALNKDGSVFFLFFCPSCTPKRAVKPQRDRAPQSSQATKPSSVMHLPELALVLKQPSLLIVPVLTTSWSWCVTDFLLLRLTWMVCSILPWWFLMC